MHFGLIGSSIYHHSCLEIYQSKQTFSKYLQFSLERLRVRTSVKLFLNMSQQTTEMKKKYECELCDKAYVGKPGLLRHKEAKHDEKSEKSEVSSDNGIVFEEDDDFNEAVEDQDLNDMMEQFSQKAASKEDISYDEINSLNKKLQRYRAIMKKKTKFQKTTITELAKVREEKAEMRNEIEKHKHCEKECNEKTAETEPEGLKITLYKCDMCGDTFKTNPNLINHKSSKHVLETKTICNFCESTSENLEDLQKHISVQHILKQKMESLEPSKDILGQLFICGECDQSYKNHDDFVEHIHEESCQSSIVEKDTKGTQYEEEVDEDVKQENKKVEQETEGETQSIIVTNQHIINSIEDFKEFFEKHQEINEELLKNELKVLQVMSKEFIEFRKEKMAFKKKLAELKKIKSKPRRHPEHRYKCLSCNTNFRDMTFLQQHIVENHAKVQEVSPKISIETAKESDNKELKDKNEELLIIDKSTGQHLPCEDCDNKDAIILILGNDLKREQKERIELETKLKEKSEPPNEPSAHEDKSSQGLEVIVKKIDVKENKKEKKESKTEMAKSVNKSNSKRNKTRENSKKDKEKDADNETRENSKRTYSISCNKCNRRVRTREDLTEHVNEKHMIDTRKQCYDCNTKFKSNEEFTKHVCSHHDIDATWCDFCGKTFSNMKDFWSHIRSNHCSKWSQHNKAQQIYCYTCGKMFNTYSQLRRHIKMEHRNYNESEKRAENNGEWQEVQHGRHQRRGRESYAPTYHRSQHQEFTIPVHNRYELPPKNY